MVEFPKVSVIVPVHNAETTIDVCLNSILNQDYPEIECILIENGSTDSSKNLCERYSQSDNRIQFAVSYKTGVSEARNLGLSIAGGDIIGFCDSDDFLEPGAISTVVSAFQGNPDVMGVFGAFYVGVKTQASIQKTYKGLKETMVSAEKATALTIADSNVMGSLWNKYYRAETVKDNRFDATLSYCEDTHFNVKMLSSLKDAQVKIISEPLYCYVQDEKSATHRPENFFDENGELKYIVALKKILADCPLLSSKSRSLVKMQITALAIDHLRIATCDKQKITLKKEVSKNIFDFLKNMIKFNFKANLKRLVKLFLFLVK